MEQNPLHTGKTPFIDAESSSPYRSERNASVGSGGSLTSRLNSVDTGRSHSRMISFDGVRGGAPIHPAVAREPLGGGAGADGGDGGAGAALGDLPRGDSPRNSRGLAACSLYSVC